RPPPPRPTASPTRRSSDLFVRHSPMQSFAEAARGVRIGHHAIESGGQPVHVVRLDQQAALAMDHDLGYAAHPACHDWKAIRPRFEQGNSERLSARWKTEGFGPFEEHPHLRVRDIGAE